MFTGFILSMLTTFGKEFIFFLINQQRGELAPIMLDAVKLDLFFKIPVVSLKEYG